MYLLKNLNFLTIAVGDSYNDLSMLLEADQGILFRPINKLVENYPQLPVAYEFNDLKLIMKKIKI